MSLMYPDTAYVNTMLKTEPRIEGMLCHPGAGFAAKRTPSGGRSAADGQTNVSDCRKAVSRINLALGRAFVPRNCHRSR